MRPPRLLAAAIAALLSGAGGFLAGPAGASASHAQINGDGSSWASNAVNQWIADVNSQGLQVVFTSTGSAQGRQDFANGSVDFAVSDIGYQGVDALTGQQDASPNRSYVYLPIVAGGTAFAYQIRVGGQLVRNLRLSGQTLAKIFTNQITNWSDPAITADNNGRALPSIPIVPVVHSEGSGSTAQFTTYLDTEFPALWRPFLNNGGQLPPGKDFTEYWPAKGNQVAEDGSDNIENFVSAAGSNGAIGYDEYSYPLGQNQPVAKIENAAGYFTLPTQYDVAVALTQAQIDPQTLLQTLTNVYTYSDPRTYPLSSYSYGIIPTGSNDPRMTTAKRQTLVDYLYYSICGGQKEIGPIGYSSLPLNLVQASFNQIDTLKTADAGVDITARDPTTCNNPTFDPANPGANLLAQEAPQPPACDQSGQGPCGGVANAKDTETLGGGATGANGGGGQTTAPSGPGPTGSSPQPGASPGPPGASPGPTGGPTGKGGPTRRGSSSAGGGGGASVAGATGITTGAGAASGDTAVAQPTQTQLADGPPSPVPFRWAGAEVLLIPLSLLLLLVVVVGPPVVVRLLGRRGDRR